MSMAAVRYCVLLLGLMAGRVSAQDACARLADLKLDGARIDSVTMSAGTDFPAVGQRLAVHAGPRCEVNVVATPTADSQIRFTLWLPLQQAWNGKYLQKGSGGWGGDVYTYALATPLGRGYATAVADDGHASDGTAHFMVGHPEKLIDFGYRAIHETSRLARPIIVAYYGAAEKKAYFVGCSDGGREALMQAQRYPDDFDGIVAGAPAAAWNELMAGFVWNERAMSSADGKPVLTATKLGLLQAAALRSCDAMDGLRDGLIDDPRRCLFDPETLLCKAIDSDKCLTRAQVDAVKKVYGGPVDPVTGARIHPGLETGTEADPFGWRTWLLGGDQAKFGNSHFGDAVYQGAPWNWRSSDLHGDLVLARSRASALDATNPDLREFRAHGGKLLLFHGWGDAALPPRGTIEYVEDVRRFMEAHGGPGDIDDFARLFMAPGMGHCWGGPGATSFGNEEVPAPGLVQDADHDIVMALDRWVEHGQAPGRIVATRTGTAPMTRPLCVYPAVARYSGKGSSDDAANFSCVAPP
jgi:hypothetical protein